MHGLYAYILSGFRRNFSSGSAAQAYFLQVQFHQMLEVIVEVLLREAGKELRLGALVDLTNALNQLTFAHLIASLKVNSFRCRHLHLDHYRHPAQIFFNAPNDIPDKVL